MLRGTVPVLDPKTVGETRRLREIERACKQLKAELELPERAIRVARGQRGTSPRSPRRTGASSRCPSSAGGSASPAPGSMPGATAVRDHDRPPMPSWPTGAGRSSSRHADPTGARGSPGSSDPRAFPLRALPRPNQPARAVSPEPRKPSGGRARKGRPVVRPYRPGKPVLPEPPFEDRHRASRPRVRQPSASRQVAALADRHRQRVAVPATCHTALPSEVRRPRLVRLRCLRSRSPGAPRLPPPSSRLQEPRAPEHLRHRARRRPVHVRLRPTHPPQRFPAPPVRVLPTGSHQWCPHLFTRRVRAAPSDRRPVLQPCPPELISSPQPLVRCHAAHPVALSAGIAWRATATRQEGDRLAIRRGALEVPVFPLEGGPPFERALRFSPGPGVSAAGRPVHRHPPHSGLPPGRRRGRAEGTRAAVPARDGDPRRPRSERPRRRERRRARASFDRR